MAPPSTPAEALDFLSGLAPSALRQGLDRIHGALKDLKNPERAYPSVHVAGTNGKGSTCAFVASCLAAQGYHVGLYTSPHLVRPHERFRVGGKAIDDETLGKRILEVIARVPQALKTPSPLAYFEFATLVALWHFAQERVDVAVLETGLGGRLDATNAVKPLVSAITPISYDHMDLLGHSLKAIAAEKAGILKPFVPAVIAPQAPEVLEVLVETARQKGAPVRLEGQDFWLTEEGLKTPKSYMFKGTRLSVGQLWLSLRGEHQRQNAAVALACLEVLGEEGLTVTPTALREGLASADWPGRLEEVAQHPALVLDAAHNPAGIEALARALPTLYPGRAVHLVFGVLADKDHRPMIRTLFPLCQSVHLCPLPSPRTLAPERYLEDARGLAPRADGYPSIEAALAGARAAAGPDDVVVCAGSLFLVGAVKALVEGKGG